MGILECKYICNPKEIEEKMDIINYNYSNGNNNEIKSDTNYNKGLDDLSYSRKITLDETYISFKKFFEEKLPLIGKYISLSEFESLIPEEPRRYMTENILDISKYLSPEIKTYEMKPVEFIGGNVYRGNWNENAEMQGYGQYYLKEEKVLAEGVWKEGCLIFARVFLPNGDLYEGEFQNSVYNGKGKLVTNNGEIYEGNFINGEKNGLCSYLFPDGTVYNGLILNGFFDGEGNIKWNNGIQYKGNFSRSTLTGFGVMTNLEGDKYIGFFDKNYMNGQGKFYFDNGDFYEGNFQEGKRNGKGKYIINDGLIYEGEWADDLMNGFGKIEFKNKNFKCIFRNGEISEISLIKKIYNHYNEDNYDYKLIFNMIKEFKPEESSFSKIIFSHLEYENNIISQYGPEIVPSFINE